MASTIIIKTKDDIFSSFMTAYDYHTTTRSEEGDKVMVFFCDDTESHKIKQNSYPDVLFVTEATDLTTFPQMVQNMVEEQQNLIKLVWSSHSIEGLRGINIDVMVNMSVPGVNDFKDRLFSLKPKIVSCSARSEKEEQEWFKLALECELTVEVMDLSSEEKKRAFQKKYPVDYEDYDFENSSHQYTLSSDSGDESSDDE